MSERLGRAVLELVTDPSQMRAGLTAARTETLSTLQSTQRALQSMGSQIASTGAKMTVGITVPVLAAGRAITDTGLQYDQALRRIAGLTGVAADQVDAMRGGLEELAKEVGRGPAELAEALYFIVTPGMEAADALDILRASAQAAAAGLGETQTVAYLTNVALNAFSKQGLTATDAVDTLIAAVRESIVEAPNFASAMGTVMGSAGQLGVTFQDTTAAVAAMTRAGITADEATTSLNQIFVSLLKTTPQAAAAMEGLGTSSEELRAILRERGLLAFLQELSARFGDNEEAAAAVFGNIRALRGVLALTGLDAETLSGIFERVAARTGSLAAAFEATEGPARDMARAQADLDTQMIALSRDVLPVVIDLMRDVAGFVRSAVDAFEDLDPATRETVVRFLAIAAAVGPVLVILGAIVGAIGGLIGAGSTLATFLTATLIPKLVAVGAALLAWGVEALATVIFATGIPALEAFAVALLGVEAAAGPIVITLGLIGGAIALMSIQTDAKMKDLVESLATLKEQGRDTAEAWDAATTAFRAWKGSGHTEAELRAMVDAQVAQNAAIRDKADATNMAILSSHAASERADAEAESQGEVKRAYERSGQAATDMAADLREALGAALADEVKFASDTLTELQRFRSALESAFAATKDAATDAAETQYKITIKTAELARMEEDYTKNHKGWTAEQLAAWKLAHSGAVKELSELKFHAAQIGTAMQQEQSDIALVTSQGMKDGLASEFPEVKAAYENLRDQTLLHLWQIAQGTGPAANAAASDLRKYLDPSNPLSPLHNAASWGGKTAAEWLGGLTKTIQNGIYGTGGVYWSVQKVANILKAGSPPGPESPLHFIDVWGLRTGEAYVDGLMGGLSRMRATVPAALANAAGILGTPLRVGGLAAAYASAGIGAALATPAGGLAPAPDVAAGGAGGGDTFNLYLPDARHTDPWAALDRMPRYAKQAKAEGRTEGWKVADR